MGDTGATGFQGFTGPTGPNGEPLDVLAMFPSAATGPVEPPHIATIDELMASLEAVVSKENQDKYALSILSNQSRETLRAPLFQWAAAGFPLAYIVYSLTIVPPPICSDGVTRDTYNYINYCLGISLSELFETLQSKVVGMTFSYSILDGNTLCVHVTKN